MILGPRNGGDLPETQCPLQNALPISLSFLMRAIQIRCLCYGCSGLAQGGSYSGGPVPGHFQLEKPLGFQWEASLQLPNKCHHMFLAKFLICEESSCTPQWSPDAFKALAPRECTGPAWSWSNRSMKPAWGGRATASSRTWLAGTWLKDFCSLFIGMWWGGTGPSTCSQEQAVVASPWGSGRTALGMPSHTYQRHHSMSAESFHQPGLIHSQRKDLEIPYFYAGSHFYSENQEQLSCISGPRISAVETGCYGQTVGASKKSLICGMNHFPLL